MIILLNGSINSGKSTVAHVLTTLLPDTAHVETDALREFVSFLPLADSIPITLENAVAVTQNLVRRGFNVVLTYPLGQADYEFILGACTDLDTPTYTITLSPPMTVALSNRGQRSLTEGERRRIREQYADDRHRPPFGIQIDNSMQTPAETAAAILAYIEASERSDRPNTNGERTNVKRPDDL